MTTPKGDGSMRISGFEIKDIWRPSDESFIRAKVDVHFSDDSFGGDMPVGPASTIIPFIAHDDTATLGKVEEELLAETLRILKQAVQEIDGKSPSAIRQAVEASNADEDARQQERLNEEMATNLKTVWPS
jgi:hypothetical protein